MTLRSLSTVDESLAAANARIARRDAELLLGHVLQHDRAWLMMHGDEPLTAEQQEQWLALVARRAAHEPLQYIVGEQEFYGLPLRVTRDTLIPRPETEHLVEAVLAWCATQTGTPRMVDVGTGTGAIALALAQHLPAVEMHAVDLSEGALAVARDNAERLGLSHRIVFQESDLLAVFRSGGAIGGLFDAVISNPPYVPEGDAATMQPEVREFEPHTALFAGVDGLTVYRRLIVEAGELLRSDGLLAMEIGYGQRDAMARLLSEWNGVQFLDDYAGIPRVVLARRT